MEEGRGRFLPFEEVETERDREWDDDMLRP